MELLFIVGLSWLVYIYAGYPLFLGLIGLWRRARPLRLERELPSVSVLIAARNEAKDIGWKISETLAWNYPAEQLDILVASDASDDSTDEIVSHLAGPRVTFVRMERRGAKIAHLIRSRLALEETSSFSPMQTLTLEQAYCAKWSDISPTQGLAA